MSVSIIVGGQYGFEGKGKIAHWLGMNHGCDYAVKTGGWNYFYYWKSIKDKDSNAEFKYKHFSSAINQENTTVYVFTSGSLIYSGTFFEELEERSLSKDRIIIDPFTRIIDKSGVQRLAKLHPAFEDFIGDTTMILGNAVDDAKKIIVEGSQGYGLSPVHSKEWDWSIPRDTTAAGVLSEVGLSPLDVDDIILVIRSYPVQKIGELHPPMKNKIDWHTIEKRSGGFAIKSFQDIASLENYAVSEFDSEMVKRAILVNNPTVVVLNHSDYFDASLPEMDDLSEKQVEEITKIEDEIGVKFDLIGNGPNTTIEYEDWLTDTTVSQLLNPLHTSDHYSNTMKYLFGDDYAIGTKNT